MLRVRPASVLKFGVLFMMTAGGGDIWWCRLACSRRGIQRASKKSSKVVFTAERTAGECGVYNAVSDASRGNAAGVGVTDAGREAVLGPAGGIAGRELWRPLLMVMRPPRGRALCEPAAAMAR
jgi:hypothetical protein